MERVGTCFPVTAPALYDRARRALALYLNDNSQAWLRGRDGRYPRARPADDEAVLAAQKRRMEGPGQDIPLSACEPGVVTVV